MKYGTKSFKFFLAPILFAVLLLGTGFILSSHFIPSAYASNTLRIMMFTPAPSTLMPVINNHLNSSDAVMSFKTEVVNTYPIEERVLLGQSLAATSQAIITANSNWLPITFIGYDNDKWNANLSTPTSELVNPAASTNTAADMVHKAGYKFAAVPSRAILLQEYQGVQWTKVDMLVMQWKEITTNPSQFQSSTIKLSTYVKGENPNAVVFVQVDPTLDTISNIVNDVNSVRSFIDGVAIICEPTNGCTPSMLDALLTKLNQPAGTATLPQPPTGLTASTISYSQINLSWTVPSNNGGSAITGYKIERSYGGSNWSTVKSNTGSTDTAYSDTALTAGTHYTYRVSAINGIGTSSPSNVSFATTSSSTNDIFANCSISGGCVADCAPPTLDPIATGNKNYDQYDGCILAGMKVAGMNQIWQGQILKAQMMEESGLNPLVAPNTYNCGGMNCGPWAVSAGSISGDSPPGPCGSSKVDPFTGQVDYSHSYGLFQSTPACDGVFALTTSLSGHICTPTTTANLIPFGSSVYFYCESETSIGGHYIDAVQDTSSPLYAKSAFNPAYQVYVYFAQWSSNFQQANNKATGCTTVQQWYLTMAYWLTGNAQSSCTLSSGSPGYYYVKAIINDYQSPLYGIAWPFGFSASSTTPQPPTGLAATVASSSQINLSWKAPSNNGGTPITGFMIEGSTDGGSTWSTIVANSGSTGTTYSNTGLTASTTYTYRVSAINGIGTSSPSNVSSATTSSSGTGSSAISLAFTEYPSKSDAVGVLTIMENSQTKPYDYTDTEKFNPIYVDFPNQRHYSTRDSLADLQGIVTNPIIQLPKYYALDYDFEHWTNTPATEQANPVASCDAAASIAHNAGLKYMWGPDWGYMLTTYQQIHWQNVDIVKIQTGYMSRTISDYSSTLPGVIAYIKAHNPNIQVEVQNSLRHLADPSYPNPVDQYNKETDLALQYGATGISMVYLDPVTSGCSCFTLTNLQTIVNHFLSVANRS